MNQYYNPQGFQPYTGTGNERTQMPYAPPQQAYQQPPQMPPSMPMGTGGVGPQPSAAGVQVPGMLPIEQSYIENILRLNKGKLVTLYATFENNKEWNAKVFKGIIEAAGRDHVILSDPQTGMRYLIPMVTVDYITFDEPIEYDYPYGGGPSLSNYAPR